MNPLIGKALISGGASLLSGILGNSEQSRNLDRQLQFQKEENQKNREYNLMLAQKQNAWNIEQWERENDYNSPEAVMERLRKANVNPDLFYGGGASNMSASSPMLTSGSPSSPVDMSPLGQKPTLGQAIQQSLHDSMIGAQIENIKADTRQKNAGAQGSEIDNGFKELLNSLDVDLKTFEKNTSAQKAQFLEKEFESLKLDVDSKKESLKQLKLETINKQIENSFKKREVEAYIKDMENKANISEQECKYLIETLTYRILDVKNNSEILKDNAGFSKTLNNFAESGTFGEIGVFLFGAVRSILGSLLGLIR